MKNLLTADDLKSRMDLAKLMNTSVMYAGQYITGYKTIGNAPPQKLRLRPFNLGISKERRNLFTQSQFDRLLYGIETGKEGVISVHDSEAKQILGRPEICELTGLSAHCVQHGFSSGELRSKKIKQYYTTALEVFDWRCSWGFRYGAESGGERYQLSQGQTAVIRRLREAGTELAKIQNLILVAWDIDVTIAYISMICAGKKLGGYLDYDYLTRKPEELENGQFELLAGEPLSGGTHRNPGIECSFEFIASLEKES